MSIARGCNDFVFGLSRTDCECFGDAPEDFEVSHSGLFLDEAPALNLKRIFAAADCENDGWKIMTKARAEGIKSFDDATMRLIRTATEWMRPPTRSVIGDYTKAVKAVKLTKDWHGMKLVLAHHIGGTATIKRIGGAFKFTGSVDIHLFGPYDTTPVYSRTIAAVANKPTWTDIDPIVLDMSDTDGQRNPTWWILYQPTPGQEALNTIIAACGPCTGKAKWSHNEAYYESAHAVQGQTWTAWAQAGGVSGSIDKILDWIPVNETQGLMLDVDFKCAGGICYGEPDYAGDEIQMARAWGSRFAAALYIVNYLTGSTRVNRESLAGGDELEQLRVSYMSKIKEYSEWIAQELSADPSERHSNTGVNTYNDCFTCKPYGPKVSTMRR